MRGRLLLLIAALWLAGCDSARSRDATRAAPPASRPSILLVTLDTTRADAVGPEARGIQTPAFNALAARGRRFRQAYATVPETLPSHSSIMTGLYPAAHHVHENARSLGADHAVLAERLQKSGYRTVAFVSSFILSRRFGLARGFEVYDDEQPPGASERTATDTTDRALAQLAREQAGPLFLWVHYFDPHYPYTPPEPFRTQYGAAPYLGEVAAVDAQLDRVIRAFDAHVSSHGGTAAIIVVGDHGEGLGEHGEAQHGALLYQATMHVPLVIVGPGIASGVTDTPVSTRRIFHTALDWAGLESQSSLRGSEPEAVLGEAMKPFLEYGWQPQVMTVDRSRKAILAGRLEVYDVAQDPGEARDLGAGTNLPAAVRKNLEEYPLPSPESARGPENLTDEARRRLASLGYVGATAAPAIRRDAPRPADMTRLLDLLDKASGLFVREEYARAVPLLEKILTEDPGNLDATLRLATAHSALGHDAVAVAFFQKAARIAPQSPDVSLYLALHYARGSGWTRAVPLLERIVAESPERLPALEALASIRERQGRLADALGLRRRIYALRPPSAAELGELGAMAMRAGDTPVAIDAFEKLRTLQGPLFGHDLELGVLYLSARRLEDAGQALDRVAPSDPEYPMALFKRAQVSVLLNEPDRVRRIDVARKHADRTTRELIAKERLFQPH